MRLSLCLLVVFAGVLSAQTSHDVSVDLTAAIQTSPAKITLNWPADANASAWVVYKRNWGSSSWTGPIASYGAGATSYADSAVAVGSVYEYAVGKQLASDTGWGLITAAIQAPQTDSRGKVILLVDNTFTAPLATEISQLEDDLVGDGWRVIRHDVSRTGTVASIKSLIVADYNSDPTNVKAVFLLGHVPVPYSGELNPDGHSNHVGAWPADGYYGDVNGSWSDSVINNTTSGQTRNHNVPGDGKFDQSVIPSTLELMVGRVDLANMSTFTQTEQQLLQAYLNRHHDFVTAAWRPQERAVIDDNFGYFSGEAFAASAWRSFSPLVGPGNVAAGDFITSTTTGDYLWAYGCGGGTYTSASGVGTTANIAAASLDVAFTCLFGSYHGDWDSDNNFLRSPLGSGALTCAWSGRPWWYFHSMGIGEPIGMSFKETINDPPLSAFANNSVHIGLMGAPTLRMRYIAPATAPAASQNGGSVDVTWTASTDSVGGYHVYRATAKAGPYTRLTSPAVGGTSYSDTNPPTGTVWYMVRAAKLQQVPSGSYNDLSTGTITSVTVSGLPPTINTQPQDASVAEGATANFAVGASGSGTLGYQWQLNGSDIGGATNSSYTTPVLTLADSGNSYTCVVSNTSGSVTSSAALLTVTVGGPPPAGGGKGGGGGGGGGCTVDQSSLPALLLWLLLATTGVVYLRRRA
ncbi:MAG: immunoglobulin domain-containing protein [Planctomycetes bacterium]|nr:immunoglobulin domain-containing protein [Planctomycetota bacterium]